MNLIATLATDGYKIGHKPMFPDNTTKVYSTWTPRSGKHLPQVKEVVCFGIQGALKEVVELFDKQFFSRDKNEVISEYKRHIKAYLGNPNVDTSHFEALHDLGYLPLEVKSLEEGTLVPFRVPMMTIENTHDDFFWLTNYLETILSSLMWKPCTTASIARVYRQVLNKYALVTTGTIEGVEFQGHDFSMRGLSGPEDAARSGMGHLLSFVGSDTLPAIINAEKYYNANVEKELVACSVAATEHSLMCAGTKKGEVETYRRLIEDVCPTGIVSIVSDTWNLWNVLENILPSLKDKIEARDGGEGSIDKVVIRPDSGNPVDILCGTLGNLKRFDKEDCPDEKTFLKWAEDYMDDFLCTETPHGECGGNLTCDIVYDNKIYNLTYSPDWNRYDKQYYFIDNYGDKTPTINNIRDISAPDKGVVELLWDTFGGTINEQGYKILNPKVGAIYGDSITIERATQICERLKTKGFASTNVVLGIGSYTYQMITRDSLGFAMKATSVTVNEKERAIFKDPITDDGTKKSAKGRVKVFRLDNGNGLIYEDDFTETTTPDKSENLLKTVFENGKFIKETSLSEIRERLK